MLSTTPAGATTGRSVRACSLYRSHPGCGPAEPPVECPLGSEPVDGVVTASSIVNTGQNRIYVATNAGTVYNFAADNGIS